MGRLIVWTKWAFEKLDSMYGSFETPSEKKRGYVLSKPKIANADLARIINSDEVQSVVRPIKEGGEEEGAEEEPAEESERAIAAQPVCEVGKEGGALAQGAALEGEEGEARFEEEAGRRYKILGLFCVS